MYSFEKLKNGYEHNWADLKIRPERLDEARHEAVRLQKGKRVYQEVEAKTGVPWWFVGLCHYRESHFNFDTYLGNGQALGRATTIVPKGRGPFTGPDAFLDGAVDALRLEGFAAATDWSIARVLYRLEGFNGFGYHPKGVNSPYLYGGSTLYGPPEARAGKFVADHVFDPTAVDTQLGTAVILTALLELDQTIKLEEAQPSLSTSAEPDDTLAQTTLLIQQLLNKLGNGPQLTVDGKSGPRTREAISRFQQQSGLPDTGIADPATFAALVQKSSASTQATQPQASVDSLRQILQQLGELQRTPQSSTNQPFLPADLATLADRVQKSIPKPGSTPPTFVSPDIEQLQATVSLLADILANSRKPQLGQVNGALGETIGNLLDGKKTAIGIGGSLITSLLAAVSSPPDAGGLAGVLGTIASSSPGLSQFTMPIFLAMTAWGILGKLEKWSQKTAAPPR